MKRIEVKAIDLEAQIAQRRTLLQEFRSDGSSIYAEQRSPYIRKRLDRLFSVLNRLESLADDEERQWQLLQRIITRLQNTDLLDHFSEGLQRRVKKILKESVFADHRALPPQWSGTHWFMARIGTLHLAVQGRLTRYEKVSRRKKIEAGNLKLRIFPETDLWTGQNLHLAIFATSRSERVAVYCNDIVLLPDIFEPEPLIPVEHPDLTGRIRFAGRTVFIWKSATEAAKSLAR